MTTVSIPSTKQAQLKAAVEDIKNMAYDNGGTISHGFGGKLTELEDTRPKQAKLFKLSDSEKVAKEKQIRESLQAIKHLKAEKKEVCKGINDQIKDFEKKIDSLCEELGEPVSALGPQMIAARDAERAL